MASLARTGIPRKGVLSQAIENKPRRPNISPLLRRMIEQRLLDLHAEDCPHEYSAVIAREFSITEELADWIMASLMLEHRTAAATLRTGVAGALDEAERARRTVWDAA